MLGTHIQMGAVVLKDRPTAATFPLSFLLPEDSHHLSSQAMALVVRNRWTGGGPSAGNTVHETGGKWNFITHVPA
jgi:hypothetical protein